MAGHIAWFLRFGPDAVNQRGKTEQVNMRHIRSADPWSTFLEPEERVGAHTRYLDAGRPGAHAAGHHGSMDGDLPTAGRRVLDELSSARGGLTVEQLHDRSGLTLLEVADAVRELSARGLVGLRRENGDDVVRATEAGRSGTAG